MNGIEQKTKRINGRRNGIMAPPRRISAKALAIKRDEARVRREARAVLGVQSRWLDTPNAMYGGKRPIDEVRSGNAQVVWDVLTSVKHGMFS